MHLIAKIEVTPETLKRPSYVRALKVLRTHIPVLPDACPGYGNHDTSVAVCAVCNLVYLCITKRCLSE